MKRIKDAKLQTQIREALRALLFLDLDQAPRKLHLHPLTDRQVPSALNPTKKVTPWSLHVTPDDRYKASFTFEEGVANFRICDEHDLVDKDP